MWPEPRDQLVPGQTGSATGWVESCDAAIGSWSAALLALACTHTCSSPQADMPTEGDRGWLSIWLDNTVRRKWPRHQLSSTLQIFAQP